MGQQIIKQPNGKYCLFSSIVDNVTHHDLTKEEIIELRIAEATERIKVEVSHIIEKLDKGESPYILFTKTFKQMMDLIKRIHGKKEYYIVKKLFEKKTPT